MNKEAFCNILTMILERRFVPPLHGMHFSVDGCTEPWFVLQWDLSLDFESFPAGVSPERYTSKVYDCINLDGTMIKHDTMSYFITEGYLT
jgi:hypothetical protein